MDLGVPDLALDEFRPPPTPLISIFGTRTKQTIT
jgi:hypothetical protein